MKFFFSSAPQFAALPNVSAANVPGFGADRTNDNRLFSVQNIHSFGARTVNEARFGYSLIFSGEFWATRGEGLGRGDHAGERRRLSWSGLIRIGPGEALTIGNAGTFVDLKFDNSAITLVDTLSVTRGRHSVRTGGGIIHYRTNVTININRRGAVR